MNTLDAADESGIIARLCGAAGDWLGCDPASIPRDALRRWLAQREGAGQSRGEVLRRLALGDEELRQRVIDAVCVGETYFFRHPEQFQFVAETLAQLWRSGAPRTIRSWSAGCSDGPEAYSLSACLRACLPPAFGVEVVGSDVSRRALAAACAGAYGRSAVRESAPLLFPVLNSLGPGLARVQDSLRATTSFVAHNLLDRPELGAFDLIFCRNVLVYLTPEAAARVVEHLISALAPGGVLLFGPMDLRHEPRELERVAGAELQAFRARVGPGHAKAHSPAPARPSAKAPDRVCHEAPARRAELSAEPGAELVARHVLALHSIERGDVVGAANLLWALRVEAPDYLPAMLELGLLEARRGNAGLATELMHELLGACAACGDAALPCGPERLPVSFYRSMAELFLERGGLP